MLKWWRKITFKLFTIMLSSLMVIVIFTYLILYFFLPTFYYDYKADKIGEQTTLLINGSESLTFQAFQSELLKFKSENNYADVIIYDQNNEIVFPKISIMHESSIAHEKSIGQESSILEKSSIVKKNSSSTFMNKTFRFIMPITEKTYSQTQVIKLKDGIYTLVITLPIQSMEEISQALVRFIPYILMVSLFLAIAGALIFSRMITKPFIYLQYAAKKMEQLDFSKKLQLNRKDELGQLSDSLNAMADNLEDTLGQLKLANSKLFSDIELAKQEERKRSQFVATISHELKSPITAVMFHLEAMIENVGPYQDRDTYLRKCYSIMEEMQELAQEMLGIARMEHTTIESNSIRISLSDIVHESAKRQQLYLESKNINIQISIEPNIHISSNDQLVAKALDNVIGNAFKYCKNDGDVRIQLKQTDQIILEVFNTSDPISKSDLENIFTAFYRIEKSRNRNTGGSGLGLYIVSEIFSQLDIKYDFQNTSDGVTFRMVFN